MGAEVRLGRTGVQLEHDRLHAGHVLGARVGEPGRRLHSEVGGIRLEHGRVERLHIREPEPRQSNSDGRRDHQPDGKLNRLRQSAVRVLDPVSKRNLVSETRLGGAAYTWDTTGLAPGTYTVHVWANNQGDSTATWEAYGSDTVTLTGCTSAELSPTSGSAAVGTQATFTATSSGCPNPVYEFWLEYPDGTWHLEQAFWTSNTWTWNSAGFPKGNYVIHVWANNQGSSYATWEMYGVATYTLT